MTPNPRTERGIVADDRGAIMVMGVFMCVILVGGLWYIAGIGDALIFRERMQEAADSVAFSAAVIQARGMNIIVMINLIMAAILAIRVAINMAKFICTVLAAVFWAISAIPFCEWAAVPAGALTDGAEALQEADSDTTTPINDALIGLNGAWTAISYATPVAALAGALEMQGKYPVDMVPGAFGASVLPGVQLPVVDDSLTKLCDEADADVGNLIGMALGPLGSIVSGAISGVLNMAPSYFCELPGASPTPPDASSLACQTANGQVCDNADAATQNYNSLVAADASPAAISAAQTQMNSLNDSCSNSGSSAQKNCASSGTSASSSGSVSLPDGGTLNTQNSSSSSSGDMAPAGVDPNWYNGIQKAQIFSGLLSNSDGTKRVGVSPQFVSIAGQGKVQMNGPSLTKGQTASWSQAEFFYDQSGAWSGMSPNAMWNFYWRARFRMSSPNSLLGTDAAVIAGYADVAAGQFALAVGEDEAKGLTKTNVYTATTKIGLANALITTGTNGPTVH